MTSSRYPLPKDTNAGGWGAVAQPFYILSIVVGGLILGSVTALSLRGCFRRREYRRRFIRAVDSGHARVTFTVDQGTEEQRRSGKKVHPNQKPVMEEKMLDIRGSPTKRNGLSLPQTLASSTHSFEDLILTSLQPLSLTLLPSSLIPPDGYLLHLLRTPSFFTSNVRSRVQIARYLRSNNRNPLGAPELPEGQRGHPSSLPVQVAYVIAMPSETRREKRVRGAAHDSAPPVAGQELCVGALSVLWRLSDVSKDEWELLEVSKVNQEAMEEEYDDMASTIRTRRTRLEDLGPAPSMISSQRPYDNEIGDYESSYLPRSYLPSEASVYEESYQPSLQVTDPLGSIQGHNEPSIDISISHSYVSSQDRAYLAPPPPRSLHSSNRSIRFEDESYRAPSEHSAQITMDSRVLTHLPDIRVTVDPPPSDSLSPTTTSTEVGEVDYDADEERNKTIRRRAT
ncbi:hypothetical protein PIIN_07132 [Serendipita indica DSM 11827]|uniref:Uncharacterized protein n=1 Tax=Serendipita indica (strain DSM 11827) TaxID=1109443 RepID=G4TPD5_SERID|nr:hypothetical protein PIIN_07132 [Serendipita indica DSM 11827]